MYFVYVLRSLKDRGFYIGCTTNIEQRLTDHNNGKTLSLKSRRPLEVVYMEEYNSAEEAYRREKQIKSFKGGVAFKKLINGGFA